LRRTDRLFELLQLFRSGRLRRGEDLATTLEVSLRTIYRDIDTLIASGIPIEAERGLGYILRQPIFLPPLTLTRAELEALNLGMAIVSRSADQAISASAQSLLSKIESVLPEGLPRNGHAFGFAVFSPEIQQTLKWMPVLRQATSSNRFVAMTYQSLSGAISERRVRVLQMEFWGNCWTCTTWCEMRSGFRVFRIDRIVKCVLLEETFKPEPEKSIGAYMAKLEKDQVLSR
jgi:predicted DNA-binding transcriptional regulator YafY